MEEIELNGVKYVKAKGVKKELVISGKGYELPFEIGKSYFIRTVTYHLLGRMKKQTGGFIQPLFAFSISAVLPTHIEAVR